MLKKVKYETIEDLKENVGIFRKIYWFLGKCRDLKKNKGIHRNVGAYRKI